MNIKNTMVSGNMKKLLSEFLKEFDLPIGQLPQDTTNYEETMAANCALLFLGITTTS
jgi:hypothetical protein